MAVSVKSCGGGGLSSSDVTASSSQVLSGYSTLTTDSNDEVMQGSIPTYDWSSSSLKNYLVYVDYNGNSAVSGDEGVTWHSMSGLSSGIYGLTYGAGKFICVGSSGSSPVMYESNADLTSWVPLASIPPLYYGSKGIAYGNGKFVVTPGYGKIVYVSSDGGATWVAAPATPRDCYGPVCFVNDKFMLFTSYNSGYGYYSTDGTTWSEMSGLYVYNYYYKAAYGNGRYAIIGSSSYSSLSHRGSTDGISWNYASNNAPGTSYDIAFGNNRFITLGNGYIYYSTDGVNWVLPSYLSPSGRAIVFTGDKFIVINDEGVVYSTLDGVTWSSIGNTGSGESVYQYLAIGKLLI